MINFHILSNLTPKQSLGTIEMVCFVEQSSNYWNANEVENINLFKL